MITKKGVALAAMLLTVAIGTPLMGQKRNGNEAPPAASGPDMYAPKPGSAEEAKAFSALQSEPNPANKVTLADQFLTTYPSSQLAGYAQRFRMESFTKLGKYKEAAAAGETGLSLEMKYMESLIAKADEQAAAAKNSKDKNKNNKDAKEVVIDKNSAAFKGYAENTQKAM